MTWLPAVADEPGAGMPRVVLADRAACGEFAVLQRMLGRLGVPSVRIDVESVAALRLSAPLGGGSICVHGHALAPAVVWARHLSPRAIPGTSDEVRSLVRADSWCALIRQLTALAPASLPGGAPGRLEQLAGAAAAGVRVPRTIVTTDPGAAYAELPGDRVVVKVLDEHFVETAPGLLVGVPPEILGREEAARARPGFPVIVQEHVEHETELRVYYLAGRVRAFAVRKSSPDAVWREAAGVTVAVVPPPRAAEDAVRRLAGLWGLAYGAFDLLLAGGEVVFLEVNADGDWRWFERRAGGRAVSAAAALMVRGLYLDAVGGTDALPPPNVLDFLSLGL
ncbi:hypothetical protein HNP84_004358 [Thermocatellispora tengchongensis]|uniref:ATP-grasp domain-containing protein n=1 Tax=Thermocatellispora tengchongensis TaxID=1073253 RepID=A0A840P7P9_9ACTN|nr:hypothetical protein [Thermocatellispora tengchongensis]MBB5134626.1 hypothetical protein [Thermocatellispora tengchongensis]